MKKGALTALGMLVLLAVLAIESATLAVLAFAAPVRPGWSTLLLICGMVAMPVGLCLLFLVRAADCTVEQHFGRGFRALAIALLAPVLGVAMGAAALYTGLLP